MREACQLVVVAHQLVRGMVAPGVTTAELDRAIEDLFERHGAQPLFKGVPGTVPFPAVTCISVNEQVVHGIPGPYELQEGDIVSVDTGCRLNGWCGDGAWTYPVGKIDEVKTRLREAGQTALRTAIHGMGTRKKWSQVARMIERGVNREGFSVVEDFVGHGIGKEMHEDPEVPNYDSDDFDERDFPIRPGLVLAIPIEEGQEVVAGQTVIILESMKMQNELKAPRDGTVARISAQVGASVEQGKLLVTIV